jgi:hypothetical protein
MTIRRGFAEIFHDDQIVVALPALDVVAQALSGLGVVFGSIERNAVLRLGLIRDLKNVEAAVGALRRDGDIGPRLDRIAAERRGRGHAPAALDLLVEGLLLQLARRFPGWIVEIGKNYRPSHVMGHPHIGGGGDGDPVPADAPRPHIGGGGNPRHPHVGGGGAADPVPAKAPPLPHIGGGGNPRHRHHGGDEREPTAGRGVRVGVLDTAMFPGPSLTGRYIARSQDILDPGQEQFTVFDGHCAFVTSCIVEQAPAAEIHVRTVLGSDGDGSAWDAAVAIAEMAETGVDVVNLSFGEYRTDDDAAPMVLRTAVKRLDPGTVVVAAAGNNGDVDSLPAQFVPRGLKANSVSYPAALPDVVGVGALDRNGDLASFTPHPAPWIRLLAPGVGLTGAYVRGTVLIEHKDRDGKVVDAKPVRFPGWAIWGGCSFAAAIVSGAIAARTVPGRRSARQALDELFHPDQGGGPGASRGIRPADPAQLR